MVRKTVKQDKLGVRPLSIFRGIVSLQLSFSGEQQ